MPIRKLRARQIFDSRGEPTVEVDIITDIGLLRTSVPSKIFPSADYEAKEIRDGDQASYNGRSILKVVETINNVIAPELLKSKLDVNQQKEIDLLLETLDGTPDKSKLGANAILGVSMACCKAAAAKRGLPLYRYIATLCENNEFYLPVPVFNVISGGRAATNGLLYQEFQIFPIGAESFAEAMKMGTEVCAHLERKLAELQGLDGPLQASSDEGGFAPRLAEEATSADIRLVAAIQEAINSAGYEGKVRIGLDVDASAFLVDGENAKYEPDKMLSATARNGAGGSEPVDSQALRQRHVELATELGELLISLEDPLGPSDWQGWSSLGQQLRESGTSEQLQLVADRLTATTPERVDEATERLAANCLLISLGQAGTVSRAIDCAGKATRAGWACLVAAGEAETEDTFVADLAVGLGAGQFKGGAPRRSEHVAKYNQLLRIEQELGKRAKYVGMRYREALLAPSCANN